MADREDREEILVKLGLREKAMEVFDSTFEYRHISLAAGRRFGKSMLIIIKVLSLAAEKDLSIGILFPTINQGREIFWYDFLSYCTPSMIRRKSESNLTITFTSGTKLSLYSIDACERIRGKKFDYMIIDEAGSAMTSEIWNKIIYPTFATTGGGSLVVGTVNGRGWFHEHCHQKSPDHKHFVFTTMDGGWVSDSEISRAKIQLTKAEFQQEYCCDWSVGSGNLVYTAFSDNNIVSDVEFDPFLPINIALDFNVDPFAACIIQPYGKDKYVVCKEFFLHSANTSDMSLTIKEFLEEYEVSDLNPLPGQGKLTIFADNSGNSRKTSGITGTDVQILRREFKEFPGYKERLKRTVSIKDRTASLDVLLENAAGERRMFVSDMCKHVIRDFRKLEWKKNSDFQLSTALPEVGHISDAISYFSHVQEPTHKKKRTSKSW